MPSKTESGTLDDAAIDYEVDTSAANGFMALFREFRRDHDHLDGTPSLAEG